jgi:glutamine synthetase
MSTTDSSGATDQPSPGRLTVDDLAALVGSGSITTVLVVAPDLQGRFAGKRFSAAAFMHEVLHGAAMMCTYVLDRDVDHKPFDKVWGGGFDDMLMVPDLSTLRHAAWLDRSAIVICDLVYKDGSRVEHSPRQILRTQVDRLAERRLSAYAASELEFIFFRTSYDDAARSNYRDLQPGMLYNADYSTYLTTAVEDFAGPLRSTLRDSGLMVEDCKGESNLGQLEVTLKYNDVLTMADEHLIYKELAKSLARNHGGAITFMPKYDAAEGNSCHIHMSVWEGSDPAFANSEGGRTLLFSAFLAGQVAHLQEMTYFFAQNINSYKRYVDYTFAPTTIAWGEDNRTTGLRVVGQGKSLRFENRIPGGDCNPYLAFAAMIAMGLKGIEDDYVLQPPIVGDAYTMETIPKIPSKLDLAVDLLDGSDMARAAFGDRVVDHYVAAGRHESREYAAAVTDWELRRSFERM